MNNNKERDFDLIRVEYKGSKNEPRFVEDENDPNGHGEYVYDGADGYAAKFQGLDVENGTYEDFKPVIKQYYKDIDEQEIGLHYHLKNADEPYIGNYYDFSSEMKRFLKELAKYGGNPIEKSDFEQYDIETLKEREEKTSRIVLNIYKVKEYHQHEIKLGDPYDYGADVYQDMDKDLLKNALKDIRFLSYKQKGTFQGVVEKTEDGTLVVRNNDDHERYLYDELQEKDLGKAIEVNVEIAYRGATDGEMQGGYDSFETGIEISHKFIKNIPKLPQDEKIRQRTR